MSDVPPPTEPSDDSSGPVGFHVEATADAGATPPPPQRRTLVIGILTLVAVALGLGAVALFGGDDPPPPATTTTTSTTTTTAPSASNAVVVATAKGPSVQVAANPPANWDTATPVTRYGPPPPPSTAEELAAAGQAPPDIPRLGYDVDGRRVTAAGWVFDNPTSLDNPFVMLVTERRGDHLQVQIPVRPDGIVGYVTVTDVQLDTMAQRIELDVSDRLLRFYDGDELVTETQVVVGKDETATPTGRFYITDRVVKDDPSGPYGPLVLATSAYSEQLDSFDGGAPVIAFHGTNNPELIGTAASNGCIRLPNDAIIAIGDRIQLGARVDISP